MPAIPGLWCVWEALGWRRFEQGDRNGILRNLNLYYWLSMSIKFIWDYFGQMWGYIVIFFTARHTRIMLLNCAVEVRSWPDCICLFPTFLNENVVARGFNPGDRIHSASGNGFNHFHPKIEIRFMDDPTRKRMLISFTTNSFPTKGVHFSWGLEVLQPLQGWTSRRYGTPGFLLRRIKHPGLSYWTPSGFRAWIFRHIEIITAEGSNPITK